MYMKVTLINDTPAAPGIAERELQPQDDIAERELQPQDDIAERELQPQDDIAERELQPQDDIAEHNLQPQERYEDELIMHLERDQFVIETSRPVPQAMLGAGATAGLWLLRVFVVLVSVMVIYTFIYQLH
jgi:hypothetical protein